MVMPTSVPASMAQPSASFSPVLISAPSLLAQTAAREVGHPGSWQPFRSDSSPEGGGQSVLVFHIHSES